jgi:misacylated tRNA(Ala) deacylase
MTEAIYLQDAYLQSLAATVTALDGECVELDRTIFYALGGGQPGDTGWLVDADGCRHKVTDTRKSRDSGHIVHFMEDANHGISAGDGLTLEIDWERRYRLMRMHSCMHLLSALIPVDVTGGSVGELKSRLDFDLGDHQIDKESLTQALASFIEGAHDVSISSITETELDEKPELVRTMSVQPPRGVGDIRMIRVEGVDFQPCGGTHVRNTSEIGAARVSKIENKGRRNRRVHIVLDSD